MGNIDKRHVLSLLIAAGGCVAGAYSAFAAYSNGKIIADGTAGIVFGLAFASVVIISWLMLPWADKRAEEGFRRDAWLWRTSWLLALGFVLANSIAYCAHYRTEMTEVKGLQIEAYERAQRLEVLSSSELNGLRINPRWEATSGCSNATSARSKQYCERVRDAQSRIQGAQASLAQGRPGAKDAGAETLAWVLSGDEAKVRRGLPIFWAVILELIASLCMREAFATLRLSNAEKMDPQTEFAALPGMTASSGSNRGSKSGPALQGALLGNVMLFSRQVMAQPQGGAMNDNMPLAAYA
jgi:hypothetical protein